MTWSRKIPASGNGTADLLLLPGALTTGPASWSERAGNGMAERKWKQRTVEGSKATEEIDRKRELKRWTLEIPRQEVNLFHQVLVQHGQALFYVSVFPDWKASMKTECGYLYAWIRKDGHILKKYQPKMANSRHIAGNTEEEGWKAYILFKIS